MRQTRKMYKDKKILAFIPARKGSKRVKNKNMRKLAGIPLFVHSVKIAKESDYIDDIIVSSDSEEILNIAKSLGCINTELRPETLSGSHARIIDSVLYEIRTKKSNYDVLILLQPTFPFRTKKLIDGAIEAFFSEGEHSLITVMETNENPVFCRVIENGILKKVLNDTSDIRSQDFKKYYRIVGNVYINKIDELNENTMFNENEIPFLIEGNSCIDIDYEKDLELARRKFKNASYNVSLCQKSK